MVEAQQWEYYVETIGSVWSSVKDENLEAALNELGQEGWQVFTVEQVPNSNKIRVVARRPLATAPRRKKTWP